MKKALYIIFGSLLLAGGCASNGPAPSAAATRPATAEELRAQMTLDQIQPVPVLGEPSTEPTSQPSDDASLDALALYARGIDDLLQSRPFDAVESLQKAILSDPNSFDLYLALGEAELERSRGATDQSFDAFEHAAAIRPDNLRIHLLLGRQYMVSGNDAKAMLHLRLAQQTKEYNQNVPGSAAVDMLLAHLLERGGYDQAALDQYLRVSRRFSNPSFDMGREPDIGFLSVEPQVVWFQIGTLYEKHGDYAKALTAYEPLAKLDPANFQLQANVVRMLVRVGRYDDATLKLADVVDRFGADSASLSLLRDVTNTIGYDKEIAIYHRLSEKNPGNRAILFAWADVLFAQNNFEDARKLLQDAASAHPADSQIARKLYDYYISRNDTASAAQCLLLWLAADPDSVREIDPLFFEVTRPIRQNSLRMSAFEDLPTPAGAQAAKLYLVAEMANRWQRDAAARSSIEAAVKLKPPFAPVFRAEVENIWARPDFSQDQKIQACRALAISARETGALSLAAEIRGLSLIHHEKYAEGVDAFEQAIRLGGNSPDLQLIYAETLEAVGKTLQSEQARWKLVAQRPRYDEAWEALYGFYLASSRQTDAVRVLQQWRQADPGSAEARRQQAIYDIGRGQQQAADEELTSLLNDNSDDSVVLRKVSSIYLQQNRIDDLIAKLQVLHNRQPNNMIVIEVMVDVYSQMSRMDDASKLLDDARKAVANDPDMLYQLAALYRQIGRLRSWEELLGEVLEIDPKNVPASNDLGFAWADAGKNLDSAEKMIRLAVDAEPDNQAFLDSMGWVLYKQSKFTEAEHYFELAIGPSALPDPEILDHYGDVLYRLGRKAEAQRQWQRTLLRLQTRMVGDDDARLLGEVQRKLSAAAKGKPADVAPLAGDTQDK